MHNITFNVYLDLKTMTRCNILLDEFRSDGFSVNEREWKLSRRITDFFVCLKSGLFHMCGEFCDALVSDNIEHMYVCKFTGISSGEVETRTMYDYMLNKNGSDQSVYNETMNPLYEKNVKMLSKQPLLRHISNMSEESIGIENLEDAIRRSDGLASGIFDLSDVISNKAKETIDYKEKHIIVAFVRLLKMFSKERFQLERKNIEDFQNSMGEELDRYATKCRQANTELIATDMYQITRWKRCQEYIIPDLDLDMTTTTDIALQYARKCLILWAIIRTRTALGRSSPNLFTFSDFIFGAMRLFENGLTINLGIDRGPVTIIERDIYLASFPFSHRTNIEKKGFKMKSKKRVAVDNYYEDGEEKKVKYKRKKKQQVTRKGKNSNKMRSDIELAITQSIIRDSIAPESLMLDSMDYGQIDRDIFIPVNNTIKEINKRRKKSKPNPETIVVDDNT